MRRSEVAEVVSVAANAMGNLIGSLDLAAQ
jgi:hypothetical protein